jgi:hypothetical protein
MPPPSSSSSRLPVCTKGWDSRPSEPASLRHVRMRAIRFLGNAYTRLLATRCHPTTSSLTMISFRTSTTCSATSTWETTPPLFPLLQPRRMCYVLSLSLCQIILEFLGPAFRVDVIDLGIIGSSILSICMISLINIFMIILYLLLFDHKSYA